MRINYNKSDPTPINLGEEEKQAYKKIFCCRLGSFPFKYLGVPLHYEKIRREGIQPIVDKIIKRIAGYKGKLLSYGARLTLLRACLASIPIYLMSIIKFPKWAIKAINTQMANFFWNYQKNSHKYHLSNGPSVSRRKEQGGMGILDLRDLNLCLLASWVQRYHDAGGRLWREIIDFKYDVSPNMFCMVGYGGNMQLEEAGYKIMLHGDFLKLWDHARILAAKVRHAANHMYVLQLDVDRPICLAAQGTRAAWH
jgi:hypothetical protein